MSLVRTASFQSMIHELQSVFINGWVPISQTTLTGSVASVTFSSIPSDYRMLSLVMQLQSDRGAGSELDDVEIRFNGDSGNNYDYFSNQWFGNNTRNLQVARATNLARIFTCETGNGRADSFGIAIGFITGYALAKEPWIFGLSARGGNIDNDVDLSFRVGIGRWQDTTAVTSMTIFPRVGSNFTSGSVFQLYGVV